MKVIKLQQQIIKDTLSNKGERWVYEFLDNEKIALANRTSVFIIDSACLMVDPDKISTNPVSFISKMLEEEKAPLILMPFERRIDAKIIALELENEVTGETVYFNKSILKYFDFKNVTFKGSTKKQPIFIYEFGNLVGMVLPIVITNESPEASL